jgi:indolepyruvate decarboxylase
MDSDHQISLSFPYDSSLGGSEQPIVAVPYYPRIQRILKDNDIVIVETRS